MKTVRCLPPPRWARRVQELVLAALLVGNAASAAVVIDDFQANQAALTSSDASTLSSAVLGGERDLRLTLSKGAVSVGVSLGTLRLQGNDDADGTVELVWDGMDNDASNLATSGLGEQDLTAGSDSALLLGIHSLTGSPTLTISIHNGSTVSSISLSGLTASSEPQWVRVPFSSFTGTASFTSVGAIRLHVTGLAKASFVLDFVRTVSGSDPTPVEALMTDVVLVDNDENGKPSPGDRLRYVVTIRNTGASNLSAVQFNATAPDNATLDLDSVKAPPLARGDGPSAASAPDAPFHTPFNTALIVQAGEVQDLLKNDFVGAPVAAIVSFGGGTLGSTDVSNAAGTTAESAGHSLTVNGNGSFQYTPATGFTGLFTFDYRLANAVASQTATVTIAVGARPEVAADAFAVTGNVRLDTASLASVTANDAGSALVISENSQPAHGMVSRDAGSGKFIYTPERGYAGDDSFTYTVGNGFGNVTGTVNITVANMVWFVDAAAPEGGDGRSHAPYQSLAEFNAANTGVNPNPADGHVILLRDGSYNEGLTFRDGQILVGDGWSQTFKDAAGFDLAPGSAVDALSRADPVINPSTGNGVNLASGNAIRGVTVGDTPLGFGYSGGAVGNLVIAECSKVGSGGAMNITGSGAFGSSVRFDKLESTASTGANLALTGVSGTLVVDSAGNGLIGSGANAAALKISGGSVNFAYPGPVSKSNAGRLIDIQNATGGTIEFNGNLAQEFWAGTGIHLANNLGAVIRFTTDIKLNTGANPAFTATGGGTITATGSGSTLTTTTGTALNVANTTIATGGIRFRSITAGTASAGPVNGIILNNTGPDGGLTVTGTSTGGSSTGGVLQRCTGDAILLTSAAKIDLSHMTIQNGSESGIAGSVVNGLNLTDVQITGNGDDSADDGIRIVNLLGSADWTSVRVSGSAHNNVSIRNSTGRLTKLAISGSTFSDSGSTFGNDGFLMNAVDVAAVESVTIQGTTVSGNKATGIHVLATSGSWGETAIESFIVSGCTIQNNNVAADFSTAGAADLTFEFIDNLNITGHGSHVINVNSAVPNTGTLNGRIQNNAIGTAATFGSGSVIGNGINIVGNAGANMVLLIDGNAIRQCPNGRGISVAGRDGTGQIDATITGNTVFPNDVSGFPLSAILVRSSGEFAYKVRSDIRNNTVPSGETYDFGPGFITMTESGASISELVDTAPTSATATAQLAATNDGSVWADPGVALILESLSTPP